MPLRMKLWLNQEELRRPVKENEGMSRGFIMTRRDAFGLITLNFQTNQQPTDRQQTGPRCFALLSTRRVSLVSKADSI
jgi:hypothetical protein